MRRTAENALPLTRLSLADLAPNAAWGSADIDCRAVRGADGTWGCAGYEDGRAWAANTIDARCPNGGCWIVLLQPELDRISSTAQEISSLALLDGDEVVFIARGSPARVFSTGLEIGYRLPAFCTSVGRALLSRFDDDELAKRLKAMRREALTPQTVTDPKLLLKTIVADRAKGFSLVDREAEPHFRSISVPVRR